MYGQRYGRVSNFRAYRSRRAVVPLRLNRVRISNRARQTVRRRGRLRVRRRR